MEQSRVGVAQANYGYVVNKGGGEISLYHYQDGDIVKRIINTEEKGRALRIVKDARPFFYLTLRGDKEVMVYCRADGTPVLFSEGESRSLGAVTREWDKELYLSLVMQDRAMRLIYLNGSRVVTQSSSGAAAELDNIGWTTNPPYRLIPVVRGGYALLYSRRIPQVQFGYREVTASAVGEFRGVYTTGFDIGDSSLCVGQGILHIAFVSVSRFAVRVMYARRTDGVLSRPKTLWEGSRCSKVCVASDGCDVFVWWESGGAVFEAHSRDNGESFSRCERYGGGAAVGAKALYLSSGSCGISELMLTEGWDICAPSPVKELIFSFPKTEKDPDVKRENRADNTLLYALKAELVKKQQEVEKLSNSLSTLRRESNQTEIRLRQSCKKLRAELEEMRAERED